MKDLFCGCKFNGKKWVRCEEAERLLKAWQDSGDFKLSIPYQEHFK